MHRTHWTLPFLLLAITTATHAADPSAPPFWPRPFENHYVTTIPEETLQFINNLGSADFATRERATAELASRSPAAFPGLQEFADRSTDPELLSRLAPVIIPGGLRLPFNSTAQISQWLQTYNEYRRHFLESVSSQAKSWSATIERYLASNRNEQSDIFIRILLDQETNAALLPLVQKENQSRLWSQLRMDIARGDLVAAEALLPKIMASKSPIDITFCAAFLAERRGAAFDPKRELDSLSISDSNLRNVLGVHLFVAKGDLSHALDYAKVVKTHATVPVRMALIHSKAYDFLATDGPARVYYRTDMAVAAFLSGDSNAVDKAIDLYLLPPGGSRSTIDEENFYACSCYLAADRAPQAITHSLAIKDKNDSAFHILLQQLRVREAMASIGNRLPLSLEIPAHLLDVGLTSQARILLEHINPDTFARQFGTLFEDFFFAALLEKVGDTAAAQHWRNKTLTEITAAGKQQILVDQQQSTLLKVQARLNEIAKIMRENRFGDNTRLELEEARLSEWQSAFSRDQLKCYQELRSVTFFNSPAIPDPVMQNIADGLLCPVLIHGTFDAAEVYNEIPRILTGSISDKEADVLVDRLLEYVQSKNDVLREIDDIRPAMDSLHRMHRDRWMWDFVQRWYTNTHDPTCWILAGDWCLQNSLPDLAVPYYITAATVNATDAPLMYRTGLALSRGSLAPDAGRQLMNYTPLLLLADSSQTLRLADVKRRFESSAQADQWLDAYAVRYGTFFEPQIGAALARQRAAAESAGNISQALAIQTQALFWPSPDQPQFTSNTYGPTMSNLANFFRLQAIDALNRKDLATLAAALQGHLRNAPPDLDLLEKTIPALKTADLQTAIQILTTATQRLKAVVEDYPETTIYAQQLQRASALAK